MTLKRTKSTAKVVTKRPRRVNDLEKKLKVIQDYKIGKSVRVIARQAGMSHSIIATILNKKKVRAVKSICFIESNETNTNSRMAYIK